MSNSTQRLRPGALWNQGLSQGLTVLRRRWATLSLRERWLVGTAALVVAAAVLWLVFIRPAWRTLHTAPAEIVTLQQTLQRIQQQAQQITALRNAPAVTPFQGNLQEAIGGWFGREDSAAQVQAQVLPGEATLTVSHLQPAVLAALPQAARRDWSAHVDAVELKRGADNLLSGTIHLVRHAGGNS